MTVDIVTYICICVCELPVPLYLDVLVLEMQKYINKLHAWLAYTLYTNLGSHHRYNYLQLVYKYKLLLQFIVPELFIIGCFWNLKIHKKKENALIAKRNVLQQSKMNVFNKSYVHCALSIWKTIA